MYESFKGTNKEKPKQPLIFTTKGGLIKFNKDCIEKYFNDMSHIKLCFDKELNKIGILCDTTDNCKTYNLFKYPNQNFAAVKAKDFFKFYGIPLKKAKYVPILINNIGLLEIQL